MMGGSVTKNHWKLMDSDSEYYYFYQEKEELPILLQV